MEGAASTGKRSWHEVDDPLLVFMDFFKAKKIGKF